MYHHSQLKVRAPKSSTDYSMDLVSASSNIQSEKLCIPRVFFFFMWGRRTTDLLFNNLSSNKKQFLGEFCNDTKRKTETTGKGSGVFFCHRSLEVEIDVT